MVLWYNSSNDLKEKVMKDWMDCFECGAFHWGAGLCDDCSTQESDNYYRKMAREGVL